MASECNKNLSHFQPQILTYVLALCTHYYIFFKSSGYLTWVRSNKNCIWHILTMKSAWQHHAVGFGVALEGGFFEEELVELWHQFNICQVNVGLLWEKKKPSSERYTGDGSPLSTCWSGCRTSVCPWVTPITAWCIVCGLPCRCRVADRHFQSNLTWEDCF